MKIGIIGSGPTALEAALYFESIDCMVSIFFEPAIVEKFIDYSSNLESPKPTKLGLARLGNPDVNSYVEEYFKPLIYDFQQRGTLRECSISRVSKSHLSVSGMPKGTSRMSDLFRVTFEMDTGKLIEEQAKLNEMAFNNISPESLLSLKRSIEMAEDFDLVIFSYELNEQRKPIGVGQQYCLNELYFNQEENFIETDSYQIGAGLNEISIFGDANGVSLSLYKLAEYLKDEKKCVTIVSQDKNIIENLGRTNSKQVNEFVTSIKNDYSQFLSNEEIRLKDEMKKWEGLEDYERVKFPKPQMRDPQIKFKEGMSAISIDRLDESKKFFVTIEPTKTAQQFEEFLGVSTISADIIINANERRLKSEQLTGLDISNKEIFNQAIIFKDEPGLFNISNTQVLFDEIDLKRKLDVVMNEINKYFSKK